MLRQLSLALWRLRDGDHTLLFDFPLNEQSVVVDAGGYVGEWTQGIVDRYHCLVELYEPQRVHYRLCSVRFAGHQHVVVHHAALGDACTTVTIGNGIAGRTGEGTEKVRSYDAALYLPSTVTLLKLNVEGAEYDILRRLDNEDRLTTIHIVLVQFHEQPGEKYGTMRRLLRKTHRLLWQYPGVWEAWQRKE